MIKKRFNSFVAVSLSLALVWTGADVAQSALILRSPETIPGISEISFQRNQEKMRLETQALATIAIDALDAEAFGNHVPFWGRWYSWVSRPIHPHYPELTWSLVGGAVFALLMTHFQSMFLASSGMTLACGVIASIGRRSSKEQIAANRARYPFLSRRGIQSTGYRFKYKVEADIPQEVIVPGTSYPWKVVVTKLGGNKKWFGKRGNRVDLFFDELEANHATIMEKAVGETSNDVTSQAGHTRYATTGANGSETVDDLTDAAQPATWVPGEMLPRSVVDLNGEFKLTYEWLENSFGFNGDADAMKKMLFHLFNKTMDNDELRVLLAKIHYTVDIPANASFKKEKALVDAVIAPGDCPTMAGLVDLFHTQGFWFPSLKYAHAIHVRRSPKDLPPSKESMEGWAQLMDVAFLAFRPQMKLRPGQSIEDLTEAQLQKFQEFVTAILSSSRSTADFLHTVVRNPEQEARLNQAAADLKRTLGEDLQTLLYASIHAFAKNSLPYAVMHEIKPRFEGTIGGKFVSTALPAGYEDLIVGFFQGQPGSIVMDASGQNATLSSDRRVNQVDPDDKWRFDLNSGVGQVFLLGHDGKRITLAIYSGPENQPLTNEDILKMRRDVRDPKQVDPLPLQDPRYLDDQPLESEVRHLPGQLKEFNDAIENGTDSDFLIPATEFTRVLMRNRIWERIRRKIDIGERNIPADVNTAILAKADELSRMAWMRKKPRAKANTFGAEELEGEVDKAAEGFTRDLIGLGFSGRPLTALFKQLQQLITDHARPESERVVDILHLLLNFWKEGFLVLFPSADSEDRLETDVKDLVVIGSEKGDYAGTAFAEEAARQFGLRQAHYVSNDVLVEAVRHKKDVPGFLRMHGIDPERTVVLLTSESGETFDTELACEWIARTVKEVFVMTGGKDNRLSDLVGRNRTFHFRNPLSMEETHFAAYAAMTFAFTRLLVFMGENISSRFGGKKGQGFFKFRWTLDQWGVFRKSLKNLIDDQVPDMMGYKTNHEAIPDKDLDDLQEGELLPPHQRIKEQAHYLAEVVKESPTVKIWTVLYIAVSVITGTSLISALFSLTGHLLNIHWNGFGMFVQHGLDVLVYSSLVLLATLSRRLFIKMRNWFSRNFTKTKRQWPTPSFMVGFGGKSLLIVDSEDYVWMFAALMGRKAFGMAYGINTPSIEGDKLSKAPHQRSPTASRRLYLLMGRPDNRFEVLRVWDDAAFKLGQQTKSILTLPYMWMRYLRFSRRLSTPISPHVVTYGSGQVESLKKSKAFHRHMPIPQEDTLPTDVPDHVALLYGSRIDAFKRMLVLGRMLTAMSIEVGSQRPYDFTPGRTHPNTGSQTTQCTVPGVELVALLASMPLQVERIEEDRIDHSQPNPFKVISTPIRSWTPQLEDDVTPSSHDEPSARARTQSPKVEIAAVSAPVWTAGVLPGRRMTMTFKSRMTQRLTSPRWWVGSAMMLMVAAFGLVYTSVHHAPALMQVSQQALTFGDVATGWMSAYRIWMGAAGFLLLAIALLLQYRKINNRWPWVAANGNGHALVSTILPTGLRSLRWPSVKRTWAGFFGASVIILAAFLFATPAGSPLHDPTAPRASPASVEAPPPVARPTVIPENFGGEMKELQGLMPDNVLNAVSELRGASQDPDVQRALDKQYQAATNMLAGLQALNNLKNQAANGVPLGDADRRALHGSLNAIQGGLSEAKSVVRSKLPGHSAVEKLLDDEPVRAVKGHLQKLALPAAAWVRPFRRLGMMAALLFMLSGIGSAMTGANVVLAQVPDTRTIETVRAITLGANDSPWRVAQNVLGDGRLAARLQELNPHARWWVKDTIYVPMKIQVANPSAPKISMPPVHFFPGEHILQWIAYHPGEAVLITFLFAFSMYLGYRLIRYATSRGPRLAVAFALLWSFLVPGTPSYPTPLPQAAAAEPFFVGDRAFKARAEEIAGGPVEDKDWQAMKEFLKSQGRLLTPGQWDVFVEVIRGLDLIQPEGDTPHARMKAFLMNMDYATVFTVADIQNVHPKVTMEKAVVAIADDLQQKVRLHQVIRTFKTFAPVGQKWVRRGAFPDQNAWYAEAYAISAEQGGLLPLYPLLETLSGSEANYQAAVHFAGSRESVYPLLKAIALTYGRELSGLSDVSVRSVFEKAAGLSSSSGQAITPEALVAAFGQALHAPSTRTPSKKAKAARGIAAQAAVQAVGDTLIVPIISGNTLSQKIVDILTANESIRQAAHSVPFWWGVVDSFWDATTAHRGANANQVFDGEVLRINVPVLVKNLTAAAARRRSQRVNRAA